MQLFAIIARQEADDSDRRSVVEAFLKRQLNQELVQQYLGYFDEYYLEAREKQKKSSVDRRTSAIAVRVLRICTQINDQLTQDQKIIVLVQLLEFCKTDNVVSALELEFIQAVSETFNVSVSEHRLLKEFVLNRPDLIPDSPEVLIIDNRDAPENTQSRHMKVETLKGQIWVLYVPSAAMYFVKFNRTGELYMNGQLLQEDKTYPFNPGSSLRDPKSSPIYYSDVTRQFIREELQASRVVYEVKDLFYRFRGGNIGIHKMSFAEESGRMVGIMGASGAGKSTLLSILNGTNTPSMGKVMINGIDIHHQKEEVKGLVGYVSQDDLLIEELTVYENLYYNAKLCFDNLSEDEIKLKVIQTLKSLGLFEIRDMKVGSPLNKKISGGQRKRLNISLELIREPSILFLDEPTSGLSSRDSENIVDLLKELSLKGKLLFVVIHQPSSDIFKMFDRLIILDTGGYLIYNGNPVYSIEYFKRMMHHANYNETECHVCGNVNPEQVFNIVESRVLDEYGQLTNTRRISPEEWGDNYIKHLEGNEKLPEPGKGVPDINFKTPNRFKQFLVFMKRDILSKLADTQYLLITLLEAPVLAFALSALIKYFDESAKNPEYTLLENTNLPVYIFMSVIIAIFMGLTVSAEEIIKDRKILKREAFLNLSWNSYLMSKVMVQFLISAIQAITFVIIGNGIIEIRGMMFEYWLVLFTAWASSNMMGLLISDSFKAVVTIYILIPFLVIPQIILSGIMVKYEKLNPNISSPTSIPFYGEAITARWGYEALAVKQFMGNKYERDLYQFDKNMSITNFRKNFWCPTLKGKIDDIENAILGSRITAETVEDLNLLRNEITIEGNRTGIRFDQIGSLYPDKLTPEVLTAARNHVDLLLNVNKRLYNEANELKDALIEKRMKEDRDGYLRLKKDHYNTSLEEFVKNSNEKVKIIEYKGRIIQKIDPIFLDPESRFIRAHFYAPGKQVFGTFLDTYWVNVIVMWIMTALLYLALYFRLLKRGLESAGVLFSRFSKQD
jgi:ABC-type multidrug transport system ATPase subunit